MNKTYIRSKLREAGKGMHRIIERMNYEAREQLQKENPELQRIERDSKALYEKLAPLTARADKIKKKIRKEVSSRHLTAKRRLDESWTRATDAMNTAITESELIEARDRALLFIKHWETWEATMLKLLKGEK